MPNHPAHPPEILMPQTFAVVAGVRGAYVVEPTGEVVTLSFDEAARRIRSEGMPIVCHARQTGARLGVEGFRSFDILELFAFVEPARFCLPTPSGVAQTLGLSIPRGHEDEAAVLITCARTLLERMSQRLKNNMHDARAAARLAHAMNAGGWPWGKPILAALGEGDTPHSQVATARSESGKAWPSGKNAAAMRRRAMPRFRPLKRANVWMRCWRGDAPKVAPNNKNSPPV